MVAVGPGGRIPEETNPTLVFRDGKPVLASSSIGSTHYRTIPALYNFVANDLDVEAASLAPYLLMADFSDATGAGIVEQVTEGLFEPSLIETVRGLGQQVNMIPLADETEFRGYWVGIGIDL